MNKSAAFVTCLLLAGVDAGANSTRARLRQALLANYCVDTGPLDEATDSVDVYFGFFLYGLLNLVGSVGL